MLEVPPVPDLTAEGLASTALRIFRESGFTDEQLEGLGWDGEYVKKNVFLWNIQIVIYNLALTSCRAQK